MDRKLYGPAPVFEIKFFERNHVLTFLKNKWRKMHFSQKKYYSKTNKAIDVVFTGNLNQTLFYTNMGK